MQLMTRSTEAQSPSDDVTSDDLLVGSAVNAVVVTKNEAMAIPAFSACVDTISGTVASLPIRLYRRGGDSIEELEDDPRVIMLNGDTGDTLTGPEMIKSMVEDYYCADTGGNMFVNKRLEYSNEIQSLHYVRAEDVQPLENKYDPIFKQVRYNVAGRVYEPWQFVRILHSTRNGRFGRSVITANQEALQVAYMTMLYERSLVQRGGSKRGFLSAPRKLGKKALEALRGAWRRFYGTADESVVIMNDGLTFQEASTTSTEMQLNENKQTNAADIYSMFKMPPEIIRSGGTKDASKNARDNYVRFCIMPLLSEFAAALNRSLLLESEKGDCYFGFDLSEFTKADMKERWESWKIAKEGGFVMPDEVRKRENMPPLGLTHVSMNLRDVLFDVAAQKIIVPNTGGVIDLNDLPTAQGRMPAASTEGSGGGPIEGGEIFEGSA